MRLIVALCMLLSVCMATGLGYVYGNEEQRKVEISPNWCGAKCVWILAHTHGKSQSFEEIREFASTVDTAAAQSGRLSVSAVCQTIEWLGLHSLAVRCTPDWLKQFGRGSIVVLEMHQLGIDKDKKLRHAVIFLDQKGDNVEVVDPIHLAEVRIFNADEFFGAWTGEAILVKDSDKKLPVHSMSSFLVTMGVSALFWMIIIAFFRHRSLRQVARGVTTVAVLSTIGCGGSTHPIGSSAVVFDSSDYVVAEPVNKFDGKHRVIQHTFTCKNTTDKSILLKIDGTSCACASARLESSEVPSGGIGVVHLELDTAKRDGWVTASVVGKVELPGDISQRFVVSLSANLVGKSKILPSSLEFLKVAANSKFQREVRIMTPVGDKSQDLAITASMRKKDSVFHVEVVPVGISTKDKQDFVESKLVVTCQPNAIDGEEFRDFISLEVRDGESYEIPINGKVARQ